MTTPTPTDDIVLLPDLIDQLSEAPIPAPIAWTPQTWGWWMLGGLILVLLTVWALRRWQHWRADAYRRAALSELDQRLPREGVVALADILRRTALGAYPREQVAGLTGQRWWRFLDTRLAADGDARFDGPLGQELSTAPYRTGNQDGPTPPSPELMALAQRWIRRHRRDVTQESTP